MDSCISQHLYNNHKLFKSTYVKNIDFVTTGGQIIRTDKVRNIAIFLVGGFIIKIHNIIFTLQYNSNLILLGQLHKNRIIYYDNTNIMILIKNKKAIKYAKKEQNLFPLDFAFSKAAMIIRIIIIIK